MDCTLLGGLRTHQQHAIVLDENFRMAAVLPHTPGQDEIYFPETPKHRHNMLCGDISKTEKQTMHQSEINDDFL